MTNVKILVRRQNVTSNFRSLPESDRKCRFKEESEGMDVMKEYTQEGCR